MPIIDSTSGAVKTSYITEDLINIANEMRAWILTSLCAAGSGHSGGSLSCIDILTYLYMSKMKHDPESPNWDERDRFILSAGHKAPALYTALALTGYVPKEDLLTLRKLDSPFQGHPHWLKLPGIEVSSGSLGQGLSVSVGMALRAKIDNKKYRIYCLMGDGEQQEGQVWEAAMSASHYKLNNITAIIDCNSLQIDGRVKDVMNIDPIKEKYESFGWHTFQCNGHDFNELSETFEKAEKIIDKPSIIIARTIKGKGIDFMEDQAKWHGRAPDYEELKSALSQLKIDLPVDKLLKRSRDYQKKVDFFIEDSMPSFSKKYWWNTNETMTVEMKPTKSGFGKCLDEIGDDNRIICLGADISESINLSDFYKNNKNRKNRFISMGIAEQNMTCVAAGLAKEGKIPVTGTYGVFSANRNLDQIRTSVCYGNFNVKIIGAHGGVSVGPDGATHQALEDLFQICGLPNMCAVVPSDYTETQKASKSMILDIKGPVYLRFARESTPVITKESTPFKWGMANVIRFRGEQKNFIDSFETVLSENYKNENEQLTIVSCGPEVAESMRAAWILKSEYDIEARIINMHTIKPLDLNCLIQAAQDTGIILTAEEHQVGGLGRLVISGIMTSNKLSDKQLITDMIGIKDQFGESGNSWELLKVFGLSAEHIAKRAKNLYKLKK